MEIARLSWALEQCVVSVQRAGGWEMQRQRHSGPPRSGPGSPGQAELRRNYNSQQPLQQPRYRASLGQRPGGHVDGAQAQIGKRQAGRQAKAVINAPGPERRTWGPGRPGSWEAGNVLT